MMVRDVASFPRSCAVVLIWLYYLWFPSESRYFFRKMETRASHAHGPYLRIEFQESKSQTIFLTVCCTSAKFLNLIWRLVGLKLCHFWVNYANSWSSICFWKFGWQRALQTADEGTVTRHGRSPRRRSCTKFGPVWPHWTSATCGAARHRLCTKWAESSAIWRRWDTHRKRKCPSRQESTFGPKR